MEDKQGICDVEREQLTLISEPSCKMEPAHKQTLLTLMSFPNRSFTPIVACPIQLIGI